MTLTDLICALLRGDSITLAKTRNQYGDMIPSRELFFENGRWYIWAIRCYSASAHGMGHCNCVSHQSSEVLNVSREWVLSALKELMEEDKRDTEQRQKESRWLEHALKELQQEEAS